MVSVGTDLAILSIIIFWFVDHDAWAYVEASRSWICFRDEGAHLLVSAFIRIEHTCMFNAYCYAHKYMSL